MPFVVDLELLPVVALALDERGVVVAASARALEGLDPPVVGASARELLGTHEPVDGARVTVRRPGGWPVAAEIAVGPLAAGGALVLVRELVGARLPSEAERHFDAAFDLMPVGMALIDPDGRYVRVNDACCRLLGRGRDDLLGRRDQDLTHPEDREADLEPTWRMLRGELRTWQTEKRFVRPDGEPVWVLANITLLRDDEGHPLSWLGSFQDVTERKRHEEALRHAAQRDPLTDLLNRRSFDEALGRAAAAAQEHGTPTALLLFDLDGFKGVNDRHGHGVGDDVLRATTAALRVKLRSADLAARIGGDELAVLLGGCGLADARRIAGELATAVAGAGVMLPGGETLRVSTSVGVAVLDATATCAATVQREADRDLYAAKAARPGGAGSRLLEERADPLVVGGDVEQEGVVAPR